MKFVINAQSVMFVNASLADELSPVLSVFGADGRAALDAIRNDELKEITHLKNISVRLIDGEWHIEINDELMLKHVSLIGKVARFIAPIAVSLKFFMTDLKKEMDAIAAWLNEEK